MEELIQELSDSLKSENFTLKTSFSVEEDECCYKVFQLGDYEITVEYAAIGDSEVYSERNLFLKRNREEIIFSRWNENERLHLEDDEVFSFFGKQKYIAALDEAANIFATRCRGCHA